MDHIAHDGGAAPEAAGLWRRPWGAALLMLGLIAGFFLLREHWGHLVGSWPYLLLLACPVMHLFHGHGGHGRHAGHGSQAGKE